MYVNCLVFCENIQNFYYTKITTTLAIQIVDIQWQYRGKIIEFGSVKLTYSSFYSLIYLLYNLE